VLVWINKKGIPNSNLFYNGCFQYLILNLKLLLNLFVKMPYLCAQPRTQSYGIKHQWVETNPSNIRGHPFYRCLKVLRWQLLRMLIRMSVGKILMLDGLVSSHPINCGTRAQCYCAAVEDIKENITLSSLKQYKLPWHRLTTETHEAEQRDTPILNLASAVEKSHWWI
jgi:hypothetical protein